ncbi:MAG: GGDEF domain-containing protein [Dehalobacterium sp.]
MKEYFYKLAPIILAVTGLILGICGFFLERYAPTDVHLLLWWGVILAQTSIGAMAGKLIKKLYQHTNSDSLTGLRNRRYFYKKLAYEMERFKRTKRPLSLAILDLDNFKNINDTYGHLEGDRILTELSNILKKHTRAIDTVARWGGEEFAIILPETNIEGAKICAERIRSLIENCNSCHKITVCIGIACAADKMDVNRLVALTDQALYKAKEKKNKVVIMEGSLFVEVA